MELQPRYTTQLFLFGGPPRARYIGLAFRSTFCSRVLGEVTIPHRLYRFAALLQVLGKNRNPVAPANFQEAGSASIGSGAT